MRLMRNHGTISTIVLPKDLTRERKSHWLVAADAAIPHRTSITTVPVYDADHVIAALAADFDRHGPPLVLRLDRIACQRTPEVHDLLHRYQVLPLHGRHDTRTTTVSSSDRTVNTVLGRARSARSRTPRYARPLKPCGRP
jgi:hypothetical protein